MATSITSTESFAIRAQRGEARRVVLWLAALLALALITLARRGAGGMVMASNRLFIPYLSVLVVAIGYQVVLLSLLQRANRAGRLLPRWLARVSAIFDLATAAAPLVLAAFLSPRGPIPALTAPPLLLLPLVVLMSVLHLRPELTLRSGLVGALIHLVLAIRAIEITQSPPEAFPVYLAYSAILAITAVVGMLVARQMREHVMEAAEEAAAHERVDRQVMGMQHDLSVARDIQQGLLPTRSPQIDGYDIVGMNRPADQTGGDYYDWQELGDGRLAVALADVSGHGIGPALVMAVCRAYARSTATSTPDPATLVTRLNNLLDGDLPADRFITFALAVLDRNGTVHMISAGHGPTLLYHAASKTVTQYGGDGLPLGVIPGETYGPTTELRLESGDVLVLLTDGFFEWSRPGDDEAFGIPRLEESLRNIATSDAATILRTMDETVRKFCDGSPQHDDMTAVVIRRQ